jgi:hypothetical protein
VREERLYRLVRQAGPVAECTFEIEFLDPDVRAYAFTFGWAVATPVARTACVRTPLCVVSRIRAARRIGDHAQTVNVELIGGS